MSLEFPSGPVPLKSYAYISRPPIEELAYQEITKPGSVIRIKAPKQMGKSSLVLRLLDQAQRAGYHTVYLDFLQADESVFNSLDQFLRWFCANVSQQLQLKSMLDEYWDEDIGSKVSCTLYFQAYLLPEIDRPLVLALNEVNRVFEYPTIAQDFLALLRSWYEEAKQVEILEKLRLVVIHSTEVYITLNINQSPFNVGLPIKLPEFSLEQVQALARLYGLEWTDGSQARKLMGMVGGHPYLVQLALYHLVNASQESLERLLSAAPTIAGIYSTHLRELYGTLQTNVELASALKKAIVAPDSVELDPLVAYKLESLGLVKLAGNQCTVSCELYRLYFASQNLEEENLREQVLALQKQNQELRRLHEIDELTQVANQHSFKRYLEQQWQSLMHKNAPLSLIFLDIDYLKIYNNAFGYEGGNECLQQIVGAICQAVSHIPHLVARYEGDNFTVLLPHTNASTAFFIAERIREDVENLAILQNPSFGGLPNSVVTVSLGVACTIPKFEDSPISLVRAAKEAFAKSKRGGRDRTSVSSILNYGFEVNAP